METHAESALRNPYAKPGGDDRVSQAEPQDARNIEHLDGHDTGRRRDHGRACFSALIEVRGEVASL